MALMLCAPGVSAQQPDERLPTSDFEAMPRIGELQPRSDELDSAVQATLDRAKSLVDSDPTAAKQVLFDLMMADDPYTLAQRPLFAKPAAALLRELASTQADDAIVLSDAAWTISGETDPDHAGRLLEAARKEDDNAKALWLARRALVVDPDNKDAARLDHKLSNNPLRSLGWSVFWGGIGSAVAGVVFLQMGAGINKTLRAEPHSRDEIDDLIARRNLLGTLSVSGFVVGIIGYFAGIGILAAGKRDYEPTSPANLPAIGEWK